MEICYSDSKIPLQKSQFSINFAGFLKIKALKIKYFVFL